MTLAASAFAAGAQQFASAWEQRSAWHSSWRWVASPSGFGAALVIVPCRACRDLGIRFVVLKACSPYLCKRSASSAELLQGGGYLAMECLLPARAGQGEAPSSLPAAPGSGAAALSGSEPASTQAPTTGDADCEAALEAVAGLGTDEAALPLQAACTRAATGSFHIAYSASYGVPMLLFDAHEPGMPATLCNSRNTSPAGSMCLLWSCTYTL